MIQPSLVVIVGPTASGKTSLAIRLAREHSGEIICADSRTIYKGMDIGTAKPSKEEQLGVPHWGIDLIEPNQDFNAADFQHYAYTKIQEIRARGHLPILVGGSGLYIDTVIFQYEFGSPSDVSLRQKLEKLTLEKLHAYCDKLNIVLPENKLNKRYVIRAIEQKGMNIKRQQKPLVNSIIVGIATNKDILRQRINKRAEQLFDNGVVEEATILGKKYGWHSQAMTGNIYPLVHSYLLGEMSLAETMTKFTTIDWRLAKRQLTWFRRNPYVFWGSLDEVEAFVTSRLVR